MRKTTAVLLLATTSIISFPALAQEAAPAAEPQEEGGIAEIIVTAQKRAENVQNVPIAISAFTSEALQERAIGSVAQLSSIAPNVNLDAGTPFSGSNAVLSAFIRGIGSDDFAFNIDPGVGIYVDGVYLARTVGANQDLLDVTRVEVLKGPQGTLFGRNTIGGAISIVTRDPGHDFKVSGDATVGSYRLFQARGSVDVPLTDSLSSMFTFGIKTRRGTLERIPYPDQRASNSPSFTAFSAAGYDSASREGTSDNWNTRGKLKWDGGGARVTLSGDYTKDNGTSANKLLATAEFVPGNFAGTTNLPGTAFDPTGTTGFLFAGLYNFCIGSTSAQIAARGAAALCGVAGTQYNPQYKLASLASVNVDGSPANDRLPWDSRFVIADPDKSYATGNSFSDLQNWGVGGSVDFDLSDNVALKSITAYRALHWKSGMDADGSPLNFLQLSFTMNQWQFSQEFQLLGDMLDKKVHYVLGAYYFKEAGDLHDYVTFAEGQIQVDGPNKLQTENYAAFGQLDYRPIDLIGITIGGRYTHERKQFEGGQQELNGFNYKLFGCSDANGNITPNGPFPLAPVPCQAALGYPDPTNPVRVYVPGVNRKSFSNFSPKVGIQLHPNDNVMLYGSWSKGYKTGGWTTRLTNPQGNVAPDFNEEKATTWEAGIKSDAARSAPADQRRGFLDHLQGHPAQHPDRYFADHRECRQCADPGVRTGSGGSPGWRPEHQWLGRIRRCALHLGGRRRFRGWRAESLPGRNAGWRGSAQVAALEGQHQPALRSQTGQWRFADNSRRLDLHFGLVERHPTHLPAQACRERSLQCQHQLCRTRRTLDPDRGRHQPQRQAGADLGWVQHRRWSNVRHLQPAA